MQRIFLRENDIHRTVAVDANVNDLTVYTCIFNHQLQTCKKKH
jgi:hypothetical protein